MSLDYCHDKKRKCRTRCDAIVDVDIDFDPDVRCKELSRRGTFFDFDLDIRVDPKCKITQQKRKHDDKGCTTGCTFRVELDIDCKPIVKCNRCDRAEAKFLVDVDVESRAKCKLEKDHVKKIEKWYDDDSDFIDEVDSQKSISSNNSISNSIESIYSFDDSKICKKHKKRKHRRFY